MIKRIMALALSVAVIMIAALPASARDRNAILLGEKIVDDGRAHSYSVGKRLGRFQHIRLQVHDEEVFIRDVDVTFGNGKRRTYRIRRKIKPNNDSDLLDLATTVRPQHRQGRFVKTIKIRFRQGRSDSNAIVAAYGIAPRAYGGDGTAGSFTGFKRLVSKSFPKTEKSMKLSVGRSAGRFSLLRLRALNNKVRVKRVRVEYMNGERTVFRLDENLTAGEFSDYLDLSRNRRLVSEVVVFVHPIKRRGNVRLVLYGRKEPPIWLPAHDKSREGRDLHDDSRDRRKTADRRGRRNDQDFSAQHGIPPGWVLFGSQSVGFGVDRDKIHIGRKVGKFDHIALRVSRNDIYLRQITVIYGNGQRENVEVFTRLNAGTRTRPLKLNGSRFIRDIELVYESNPARRGKAVVELYGEYSDDWISDRGQYRDHNDGWVLLGAQRAGLIKKDADAFVLGRRFGRFSSLRINTRRNGIRLYRVRVVYGNGKVEDIPVSRKLGRNESTGNIDLTGRSRFIDRIELVYRSRFNLLGPATVEVWGKR